MPTLLKRRYYRRLERVGRTEKLLGVLLLLVLVGISCIYVLQANSHQDRLFTVKAAALRGGQTPRELAVAR